MNKLLVTALLLLTMPAYAETVRHLPSHEHGVGKLNIAVDGTMVAMEFQAPGADIIGFEYTAKSESDQAEIDRAIAILSRPLDLFVIPPAADCSITDAHAELETETDHDHNDNHLNEHDNAEEGDESHTEFHAEYMLSCGNIDALSDITFTYFQMFENAVEIDVQIVAGSGASAFEVDRDDPKLDLTGLF